MAAVPEYLWECCMRNINKTKVVVTGGTGFLGGRLASRLADNGCDVVILGRNRDAGEKAERENIRFIKANLEDSAAMIKSCENAEFVFHCGGLSSDWGAKAEFYKSNVDGTSNVITACRRNNVKRLIFVSTSSVYFSSSNRSNIHETDPLPKKPLNIYAKTKLSAERLVIDAYHKGLETIIIRPSGIFGPGDTTLLPRLLAVNMKGIPHIDGGRASIDITYVENVVDSLLLCMGAEVSALGKAYNITNGEPRTVRDLFEEIFHALEIRLKIRQISFKRALFIAGLLECLHKTVLKRSRPMITKYGVCALGRTHTLDISSSRENLGYSPGISIERGLQEVANAN